MNAGEAVATRLNGRRIGDAVIASRIVPSSFFVSIERAVAAIGKLGPEVVVMLGAGLGHRRADHTQSERRRPAMVAKSVLTPLGIRSCFLARYWSRHLLPRRATDPG
ncbi:MAG: hypothetical protein H6852_19280 [Geminicoccaceae bacterium]|nr:hypothetical protein [Geminicoccaceae bacterium]